jgi:hypothetical protein
VARVKARFYEEISPFSRNDTYAYGVISTGGRDLKLLPLIENLRMVGATIWVASLRAGKTESALSREYLAKEVVGPFRAKKRRSIKQLIVDQNF